MATRATMDMAIIRMGIIGRTPTIITAGPHSTGPEAIDIIATIVTITTAGIKGDVGLNPLSWLVIRARLSFLQNRFLLAATPLSISWG
jgi:hypothetical protein